MLVTFADFIFQVVLLSGHLDSWDVGQGAMDDGGGAMISWEALSLIKDLGNAKERGTKPSVTHWKTRLCEKPILKYTGSSNHQQRANSMTVFIF